MQLCLTASCVGSFPVPPSTLLFHSSQGERASSSNETNGGRIKRQSEVKEGRGKPKANADFNRKNGGNGGDADDRDGPDWPARHSHFVERTVSFS